MCLRISSALAASVLVLGACAPQAGALPGEAVECALGAGARLTAACTLEREPEPGRFVLHHPGGGFRRFLFDPKTAAVLAADGAEPVSALTGAGDHLFFAVGDDRYRVPLRLLTGER